MGGVEQWAICPCGKCEHKGCGKQGSCELYKKYRKQIKNKHINFICHLSSPFNFLYSSRFKQDLLPV